MKNEIDKQVANKVKSLREASNMSQRTLAEMLNVSQSFIFQVENESHHSKYSVYQIYLIAKFFECEVSDIFPPINRLEP